MKHLREFFICLFFCWSAAAFSQLPATFEPGRIDSSTGNIVGTSSNVRWAVPISSPTYAAPVIADGKVLIGTLNHEVWDYRRPGSRSVLLCFDDKTGKFLWQVSLPKDYGISSMFDAYCVGISSTPTVVGSRAYFTSGRGEVFCLDMNGLTDGNDGPYTDEAQLYTHRRDSNVLPLEKTDADIIWRYDMFGELNSMPHDTNNCNIIYHDGLLIINTGNAPDVTHVRVLHPEAPSLIIMDAEKGIPLARDNFDIGSDISHGQWCSPAFGKVNGRNMIFYGGGNGCLYAVEAPSREALLKQFETNKRQPVRLETVWKFQGDPRAHQSGGVVPPFVMGMNSPSYTSLPPPLFDSEGRVFMLFGHDAWNGARPFRSWLTCIDAKAGKLLWGTGNIDGGAIAPLVMENGLLYMADRQGNFSCFDTATGKVHWKLRLNGEIWARPLIADGKIYVGTDRRMFYVLKSGLKPQIISEIRMPNRIYAPAAAAGNTLYVAGDGFLYAVEGKSE
ncbi:MAG: PQQ-binding-like beta-propeller repeat protein [Planctomycetaceae bacterium]|nr:PQQ-binding-like beta-propeller repeat protein [Planctomycetaceae bacterium]